MRSTEQREKMIERQLKSRGIESKRVLEAFRSVPREEFVPEELRSQAYLDSPLAIGEGQTISQPYTVARMSELLNPDSGDRILEVGTGSGYQAAILAELAGEVISIERLEDLARGAQEALAALGYENVKVIVDDGTRGWEDAAPYDGIIVTAASEEIPQPLLDQLCIGGRLVAPVGSPLLQEMVRITKTEEGMKRESFGRYRFVPLIED